MRPYCIVVLTALFTSGVAHFGVAEVSDKSVLQSNNLDFEPVKAFIAQQIESGKVPSMSVAVSLRGQMVWEDAFGFADKERQITATPHTLYHLASVTKTFTGAGLMLLDERGALKLNEPANKYLGRAKLSSPRWNADEATIRQIATHTAGLTTYDQACFADQPQCDTSLETMIQRYGVVFWKPGSRFDYSNLGYGVLSAIIEHVSQKSFADFLHDELFKPLGMDECAIDAKNGVATPYDEQGKPTLPHVAVAKGASSACCSADSLLKFAMWNLKDRTASQRSLISDRALDAMHNETVPTDEAGQQYGLGWWINNNQHGYRVVYDGGGTNDSKALLYTIPSEDVAVVVLANGPALEADNVADRILATLLPRYAESAARTQPTDPAPTRPPTLVAVGWPEGEWTGDVHTYEGNKSLKVTIDATGKGSLQIDAYRAVLIERFRLLNNNGFVIRARADVGTSDAKQHEPYVLGFELYRDDDTLYGATTTWSQPGARDGGLFSYFVTLKRE